MNDTLDTSLETNFNLAANLCEQNCDYKQFIEFLKNGNIIEKQLAALEINEIKSKNDAEILVGNLVGQDGKVREAVAFKINQLIKLKSNQEFFNSNKNFNIFFEGLLDINGNICRQICEITEQNAEFRKYLTKNLPEKINTILETIKNLSSNEKQYKITKRNFQLYWSLEALYYCIDEINVSDIEKILIQTTNFEDYTIREKTAKILSKISNKEFDKLKKKLKNDNNYYVKRFLVQE